MLTFYFTNSMYAKVFQEPLKLVDFEFQNPTRQFELIVCIHYRMRNVYYFIILILMCTKIRFSRENVQLNGRYQKKK